MNRIRQLREERNLRQVDIANATGIDQKTISNYETGRTNPDSYALIKLSDYFKVSIDYLVGRTSSSVLSKEDLSKKIDNLKKELDEIKRNL